MASWEELLIGTHPGKHLVQLYGEDDRLLAKNVSRYLATGLRRGEGLIVIATPEHIKAIRRHLVEDDRSAALEAEASGRLVYRNAADTLASLQLDGRPDEARFRSVVGGVVEAVRGRSRTGTVRAFGEMVSLLWDRRRRADAERLEQLWNIVLAEYACSLFCAYRLDLFDPNGSAAELQPIICSHHHVLAGSGTVLSSGRS